MEYRKMRCTVEFDPETRIVHGALLNTSYPVRFEARSTEEFVREFTAAVDRYLAYLVRG